MLEEYNFYYRIIRKKLYINYYYIRYIKKK